MIEVGADRFRIPDIMFNPSLLQTIPGMEKFGAEANAPLQGLPQMVIDSINKCDVDIRRELFSSIMLAGGTAAMQQMKERLEKDLMEVWHLLCDGKGNRLLDWTNLLGPHVLLH
jgi:actin-like protein 6A